VHAPSQQSRRFSPRPGVGWRLPSGPYVRAIGGDTVAAWRGLERVVASGRSREEAAALLGKRMAPFPPDQRPELSDIMERRRALRADRDAVANVHEALHAPAEGPGAEEAPAEPDPADKP